jgi:hypothetical protein
MGDGRVSVFVIGDQQQLYQYSKQTNNEQGE